MRQEALYPPWGATMTRERVTVPDMGNNLRFLREARGWTLQQAADALSMSRSGYQKIERGERKATLPFIARAADVYGVPMSSVIDEAPRVRLAGYVGAGHEMHYYADGDDPSEDIDAPPDVTASTVAVLVRGDSMADHIEDGAAIYYDDRRNPPTDDLIGRLCIVGLSDGRVLVKKLVRGTSPTLWHLLSSNAAPIYDQPVDWAARVTWIKPA